MIPSIQFLDGPIPVGSVTGQYDFVLVALSFLVATLSGGFALIFARFIWQESLKNKRDLKKYHVILALLLGTGIWAMHFIGMIAYEMDMVHSYNFFLTLASLGVAFLFSYFVFYIVLHMVRLKVITFIGSSILMGLGVASMHYLGMAAMEMDAVLLYIPRLFVYSIIIAVAISGAAIVLCYTYARQKTKPHRLHHVLGAMTIGTAICSMHYTGMLAAVFLPFADCRFDPNQSFESLAWGIAGVVMLTLLIARLYQIEATGIEKNWLFKRYPKLKGVVPYKSLVIMLFIGLFISGFLYNYATQRDYESSRLEAKALLNDATTRLTSILKNEINGINAAEALFYSSNYVSADEFETFTTGVKLIQIDSEKSFFFLEKKPMVIPRA